MSLPPGFVYILTNKNKTTLYVGVTNNIKRRLSEHTSPKPESNCFTKRYNVFYLVYVESFSQITTAIKREKELKKWNRGKKEALIASTNPEWRFLNEDFLDAS